MKIKLLTQLAVMSLISGCALQDHIYTHGVCVTCINNPISGKPINYDPSTTPQNKKLNNDPHKVEIANNAVLSGTITINSQLDVDTAYARIKPAMNFRAADDFEKDNTMSDWQMGDSAWRHNARPGVFYELGDYGQQVVKGVQHHFMQRVRIEKSGAGSRIHYSWSTANANDYFDNSQMKAALSQRMKVALQ